MVDRRRHDEEQQEIQKDDDSLDRGEVEEREWDTHLLGLDLGTGIRSRRVTASIDTYLRANEEPPA